MRGLKLRIDILTLFPEMFSSLEQSIIKRAREKGKIEINLINFREYSTDKHKRVDDYSYSGGAGLVLTAQPIVDCIEAIDPGRESHRIFLTPAAEVLTQKRVRELAGEKWVIILCGHYEGVDERAIELCFDECVSIGNYVLTGGEIAACVLVDAVARHVEGVISAESLRDESHMEEGVWEAPQYTRPREFRGMEVPSVLVGGDHKKIREWKEKNKKRGK
jgi:tRNA (guanine37-N1)-methyltransferase